ncbi:MAG: hypothetical protein NTW66_01245 [Candidatus Magasanikbacteria bacterium]|nr:hypothetical protein [Candidatus Magasanikbacteria bacterium]
MTNENIELHDNKSKKLSFEIENADIKELTTLGAAEYFKREFPDLNHSFSEKQKCVCCMDEGTAHKDINGEVKFAFAGSGILFPASSEEERLKKVANILIERGVTNITSHGGCGAAGLAYHRDFPDVGAKENLAEKIEAYAKAWSDKLADKIKELGHPAERTHIMAEDMERPTEFHNARVVYFDGVGGFNPNKEIGLPMGFVIERAYLPSEYTAEELKVAVNIAFGHHGFGELFSSDLPFIIIALAKSGEELYKLKNEILSVLSDNENLSGGKIKVDGLTV